MGRPRAFNETDAVSAAASVFARRGYASTSVDHLVEVTGVHRGSLYGVFGSKHGLFLRALDRTDDPSVGFDERLDLLLVGLLEVAPTDPRVRERIAGLMQTHAITGEDLGARLLARAGMSPNDNSDDDKDQR